MLQTANPIRSALIFAALSLCAVGCKQQEGQVCQADEECAAGLTCCGNDGDRRGLCQTSCSDVSVTDAGPRPDGGLTDAGPLVDGGPDEDAGSEDAGAADAGAADAGAADAGAADAGPVDAGVPDSGA